MQHNGGESTTLKCWSLEDFPEAWHLRAIVFHKNLETYILVHGDDFPSGPTGEAKARTESAARCLRAEQNCDFGPRVVAVTGSEFLGQDTDVATVESRVRACPACLPCLDGSGTDQCEGCGDSWNRRRGWAQGQ